MHAHTGLRSLSLSLPFHHFGRLVVSSVCSIKSSQDSRKNLSAHKPVVLAAYHGAEVPFVFYDAFEMQNASCFRDCVREKSSPSRFIPRQRDDRPCPLHQCVVSLLMAPRRTHTATPWAKTRPHRSLHYRARWRCGGRPSLVKTPRFPTSLAVFFTLVVKHFKSRPYHLLTPLLLETLFLKTSHCIS